MRRGIIKRSVLEIKAEELMEEWKTHKILQGGDEKFLANGRQDLAMSQQRLSELKAMVAFLKSIK
jgi:hypothetical protein